MATKIVVSSTDTKTVELSAEEEAERNASKVAWDNAAPARAMAALREKRNQLLAESDWRFGGDAPDGAGNDAWKSYRRKLRQLPSVTDDPGNPTWPSKPS